MLLLLRVGCVCIVVCVFIKIRTTIINVIVFVLFWLCAFVLLIEIVVCLFIMDCCCMFSCWYVVLCSVLCVYVLYGVYLCLLLRLFVVVFCMFGSCVRLCVDWLFDVFCVDVDVDVMFMFYEYKYILCCCTCGVVCMINNWDVFLIVD